MPRKNTPLIFLCHAKEDRKAVEVLYKQLRQVGFNPWLDKKNILPGQDWDLEIQKAMKSAKFVLVCLSQISVRKEGYLNKEIKWALNRQDEMPEGAIFLIPVKLEECQLLARLSRIQAVELYVPEGLEKLIEAIDYQLHERFDFRENTEEGRESAKPAWAQRGMGLVRAIKKLGGMFSFPGTVVVGSESAESNRPAWVGKQSGILGGEVDAFCGVASAWGYKDPSERERIADNRARAELARFFKTYTASLKKDYAGSRKADAADTTDEVEHVENIIAIFAKKELPHAQIVDHWHDPTTGEFWSLARIEFARLRNFLENNCDLSDALFQSVILSAEKMLSDSERREAKNE